MSEAYKLACKVHGENEKKQQSMKEFFKRASKEEATPKPENR